ncbi:AAC(3) family N-acetyltransferase [uncultured Cocleimonas sp.]|uniref:AAC(3) family N-acetyltransferase n=1 Tax=uncultured Cocleimonas sp. TaxID=1051587 RepID=UPI002616BDE9|nr:AAC(3) family N-acetyltransferase [uncultured Cocleimonas sp.]
MKITSIIIAKFPVIEILYRNLYWRSRIFHNIGNRISSRSRKKSKNIVPMKIEKNSSLLDEMRSSLIKMGIDEGDTILVHSSTTKLNKDGHKPDDIIRSLESIIKSKGTLVFPAFPKHKESPEKFERFDYSNFEKPFEFNKRKNKIWTGLLPRYFVRQEDVYHSSIPINTLAARGFRAKQIIGEDDKTVNYPCGSNTPWEQCLNLNAKIIMIDIDVAHSLTMIHTAEDLFETEWPIKNWYRNRKFNIINGLEKTEININERDPKWALFYCEKRLNYDLKKNNIFQYEKTQGGLNLAVCQSKDLIDFLNQKKHCGYPYYIPWYIKWLLK